MSEISSNPEFAEYIAEGKELIDACFLPQETYRHPTQQSLGRLYRFLLEDICKTQEEFYYREAIAEVGLFAVSIVTDPQGFSHGDPTRLSEILLSWDAKDEETKNYRSSSWSLYIAGDGLVAREEHLPANDQEYHPSEDETVKLHNLLQAMHQRNLIVFH